MWEYVKTHWEAIYAKLGANMVVLDRYVKGSLSGFASWEKEEDIRRFFEGRDTKGFDRGVVQVCDTVRGNAGYRERDERLVEEWLGAHGYV